MPRKLYLFLTFLLFLLVWKITSGQHLKIGLENQISSWFTLKFSNSLPNNLGARYIPTVSLRDSIKKDTKIDAELSVNTFGNLFFESVHYQNADIALKPYRLWIRYSTERMELRAGLQKINFGSASVLRPLMWFDRMDTRDPLQLTDGVYGLLGRYYFPKNYNLWLWALYGNKNPAGWDVVPSVKSFPEFGGRFQLPVPKGELGLAYHHRKADYSGFSWAGQSSFPENKAGIDFKIDLGIGIWGEFVLKHNHPENYVLPEWENYLTLGMDYTFGIGNGLNMVAEYFRFEGTTGISEQKTEFGFSTICLRYPLGIMDNLTAMVFYNWDQKQWYRFISLQRQYDFWSFYLMGFWNPDQYDLFTIRSGSNLFAGSGIQLMAVLNF